MRPSPETDAILSAPLTYTRGFSQIFDELALCSRRLEGQRDELLEALEDYFRPHGSCKTGACTRCDFEDKARAAIRKVRGEGKA